MGKERKKGKGVYSISRKDQRDFEKATLTKKNASRKPNTVMRGDAG